MTEHEHWLGDSINQDDEEEDEGVYHIKACPKCGLQQYVGEVAANCLGCDTPLN